MNPQLVVATVLKVGGEYGPEQVQALRENFERRLRRPHRFVCLTDHAALNGPDYPELRHRWRGWWSKIELFRRGALPPGLPVLFADLDTVVVGDPSDIVLGHRFTVLENFWAADRIGSGLMAWGADADLHGIYAKFAAAPEHYMAEYTTTEKWGDQGFVRFNSPVPYDRWQRLHPGRVVSFKRHCLPAGRVPSGASVVCFHGKPRPWRLSAQHHRWLEHREVAA